MENLLKAMDDSKMDDEIKSTKEVRWILSPSSVPLPSLPLSFSLFFFKLICCTGNFDSPRNWPEDAKTENRCYLPQATPKGSVEVSSR